MVKVLTAEAMETIQKLEKEKKSEQIVLFRSMARYNELEMQIEDCMTSESSWRKSGDKK